jgi:hypothetical protein
VLYLGEINDQQQASWRMTLSVFDEEKQEFTAVSLFPEDRPLPEDARRFRRIHRRGKDATFVLPPFR